MESSIYEIGLSEKIPIMSFAPGLANEFYLSVFHDHDGTNEVVLTTSNERI